MTSAVGIGVTWDEVRAEARHGIIRGYKVSYEDSNGVIKWINVDGADNREVRITGLKFLHDYKVKVLAYTSVGDGPESSEILVRTEESSKNFSSLLVILDVMVQSQGRTVRPINLFSVDKVAVYS